MIRPLEWFIGLRYLSAARGRGPVSFMSAASIAGIGLGVAALIIILSAMNGLEAESRTRLLSLSEHVTVRPERSDTDLEALRNTLMAADGVASVSPFVRVEAMLSSGTYLKPAIIRGIDPRAEDPQSDLATVVGLDYLDMLESGANRILLGRFVASNLLVQPGDRLTVWIAEVENGRPAPRRVGFTVAGVFAAGVEVHDSNLALIHIDDASRLVGRDGEPESLAISLEEPMEVASVTTRLADQLGDGFSWSNWAEENRALFRAMAIEKIMMTILLMFIAGVAVFNVVASLMMVVNEKEKDIAILRTMGLEPNKLSRIFLIQGALVGIGGTLGGVIVGLSIAANLETILPWLEQSFGFQIMPGDVFYVTRVPSEIRLGDLLLIPGFAIGITLLATIYPSRRAAKIEPADVLRYE
jgi:lipoprotein-releasing system permease protein